MIESMTSFAFTLLKKTFTNLLQAKFGALTEFLIDHFSGNK